jgi:hypothetical protein
LSSKHWPELTDFALGVKFSVWGEPQQPLQPLLAPQLSAAAVEDVLRLVLSTEAGTAAEHAAGDRVLQFIHSSLGGCWVICKECFYSLHHRALVEQELRQLRAWLQQLRPATQQELLQLALLREHTRFVTALEDCLAWEAAPSSIVNALLQHVAAGRASAVLGIAQHKTGRQLQPHHVVQLMLLAVEQRQHAVLTALFTVPAAQQLDTAQVSKLLTAACELQDTAAVSLLATEARTRIGPDCSPDALCSWLQTAVLFGGVAALKALCLTSAAEAMTVNPIIIIIMLPIKP